MQFSGDSVRLRLNCRDLGSRRLSSLSPRGGSRPSPSLVGDVDVGAALYVGQAGEVHQGAFEGVFQELKVSPSPDPGYEERCRGSKAEVA